MLKLPLEIGLAAQTVETTVSVDISVVVVVVVVVVNSVIVYE